MLVITIISDWGESNYYLPRLKGELYSVLGREEFSNLKGVVVETITNSIKPFDIVQGCFILKNSFVHFPSGSIHLMGVNSELKRDVDMVVVKYMDRWIVSPNDGRISLLVGIEEIEEKKVVAYKLPLPKNFSTFMACEQFVHAVELICSNNVEGNLVECEVKVNSGGFPTILEDTIIGKVIYIDSFGNAITNISKESFYKIYKLWCDKKDREPEFTIFINGPSYKMENIWRGYSDVEQGKDLVLFNSLNLLEFAVNNGSFAQVEGVELNSEIVIKLY